MSISICQHNIIFTIDGEWETEQRRVRDRAAVASDGVRDRATEGERQSSGAAERVRDKLAERVREQSSWERAWERKKERKRVVRELSSARVLELGFNKITILPLKMSKLTKQAFLCFGPVFKYRPVQPVFVGTRSVRSVFLPIQNIGVNRTGLLAGTVYFDRTGQYGTKLTTLRNRPKTL